MIIFNDLLKRSLYTLFSSVFLLASANTVMLPIVDSVKSPQDTISIDLPKTTRDHYSASSAELSSANQSFRSSTPTYFAPAITPTTPAPNSISFADRTIPIFYTDDFMVDSGNSVGIYNGYFLYGHNSANVFGSLPSLPQGTPITITLNGQTTTHVIVNTILVTRDQAGVYTKTILNGRKIAGGDGHTYVLMTCAGDPIPGRPGDATHRYLIYIK